MFLVMNLLCLHSNAKIYTTLWGGLSQEERVRMWMATGFGGRADDLLGGMRAREVSKVTHDWSLTPGVRIMMLFTESEKSHMMLFWRYQLWDIYLTPKPSPWALVPVDNRSSGVHTEVGVLRSLRENETTWEGETTCGKELWRSSELSGFYTFKGGVEKIDEETHSDVGSGC